LEGEQQEPEGTGEDARHESRPGMGPFELLIWENREGEYCVRLKISDPKMTPYNVPRQLTTGFVADSKAALFYTLYRMMGCDRDLPELHYDEADDVLYVGTPVVK
jgi:hypothetical protein